MSRAGGTADAAAGIVIVVEQQRIKQLILLGRATAAVVISSRQRRRDAAADQQRSGAQIKPLIASERFRISGIWIDPACHGIAVGVAHNLPQFVNQLMIDTRRRFRHLNPYRQ